MTRQQGVPGEMASEEEETGAVSPLSGIHNIF